MANTILTLLSGPALKAYYAAGHWRAETIYALAREHAARKPDTIAIEDRRGPVSYGELIERSDALAAALDASGVRRGDRVAVWLPSRIETAVALLACSRNGYVCCPSLHRNHTASEVLQLVERMRAAAFIGEAGYGADSHERSIFDAIGGAELHYVGRLSGATREPPPGRTRSTTGAPNDEDPDRVVYLAFTSGTTGRPKGVMHSNNTLLAAARAMMADWSIGAGAVIYTMSPLSHNLGLGALVMSIAAGARLVVHDIPRGDSALRRLVEVGATFLIGVPTHAMDLLDEMKQPGAPALTSLKGFRISGAAAPREVVAELLRHNVVPQSGYGMTEAGSHHYTRIDDSPERILHTSGKPAPGYEVRIWSKDDPDSEAAPGEIGEIGGRGASLMLGYFDDQAANEGAFNAHGWFMTGDLGYVDADGYLCITGRKKDLIIRGGHNIYPSKIESIAMQHPAIARAAALPVADQRLGEKVCLAVMLRPGHDVAPQDVLKYLGEAGLSRYDMPEYYLRLDDIPLTTSGKIMKWKIAAQLVEGDVKPTPIE